MNDNKKKIGDWQQETYKLRSEVIDKNEQIKEMQLLLDTANEKLKENKTSSFARVSGRSENHLCSTDFHGKCMICGKQVWIRCPECKSTKYIKDGNVYECTECMKRFSV